MSKELIRLSNCSMAFDDEIVLKNLNLYINDKEFLTLLGPSGCGKTTTLRIIGGFTTPSSGDVFFDGVRINDVPPYQRQINTVFQKYALFPHLNVFENIAFGLRMKKTPDPADPSGKRMVKLSEAEISRRVNEMLDIISLRGFEHRKPDALSGGQQQRVAIARTLAPEPQVLFMDEPLSNLDAKLRLEMRYELQRLHVETGSTFVYVTHDQMEAMTLSTKICLMNNGVLQQYAAPLMLYGAPNNLFCADFVGNPSINFIEGKGSQQGDGSIALSVLNGKKAVFTPRKPLNMDEWFAKRDEDTAAAKEAETELLKEKGSVEKENKDEVFEYHIAKVDEEDFTLKEKVAVTNEDFVLAIRPEKIKVTPQGKLDAHVNGSMPTGMESTLKLNVNGFLLTSVVFGSFAYVIGDEIHIDIDEDGILLYDRKSGKLIASGTVDLRD